jgi:23S rRNA (pseudouridine1915-N3)-methyltransferase
MKIRIVIVDKKGKDGLYAPLIEHFIKMAKPYAQVEVIELFDKSIAKAQELSAAAAQQRYTAAFEKYLKGTFSVALDPASREVDSFDFAELLKNRASVSFFIGGAYGLERGFLSQCDRAVSFGRITLSHKLVKVVLMEQIFRGLAINHNHPYHK